MSTRTCKKRITEAVLTGTHNPCFRADIIIQKYTTVNPVLQYESGFEDSSLNRRVTDRFNAVLLIVFSVFACFGVCHCTVFTFYVSR